MLSMSGDRMRCRNGSVRFSTISPSTARFGEQANTILNRLNRLRNAGPGNYLPALIFQVWIVLVVGGTGCSAAGMPGAILVWAVWSGWQ